MYRICTWNTQGDPTNTPDKLEILKTLLERNDVVLLQECTRLDHFHLIRNSNSFHIFISPQAGAYNPRCSTAMVSRKTCHYEIKYLPSGTGRQAIIADFGEINIATIHAEASGRSQTDIFDIVKYLYKKKKQFILGGDFNCPPERLLYKKANIRFRSDRNQNPRKYSILKGLRSKTDRKNSRDCSRKGSRSETNHNYFRNSLQKNSSRHRLSSGHNCRIFWEADWYAPSSMTHVGNKINSRLDYFIVSSDISCQEIYTHLYRGGDHFPVIANFFL